jgi:GNAT superfamily N-acetyltransferase
VLLILDGWLEQRPSSAARREGGAAWTRTGRTDFVSRLPLIHDRLAGGADAARQCRLTQTDARATWGGYHGRAQPDRRARGIVPTRTMTADRIDTVIVRPAVDADVDALVALNGFVQALRAQARPDVFLPSDAAATAAWFRSVRPTSTVRVWVAETGGTAIGYAITNDHEREANAFVRASRWLEVEHIAVHPEHQYRGVGRALPEQVVTDARSRELQRIAIQSWAFNEGAHAAFERWGFEPRTCRSTSRWIQTGECRRSASGL